MGKKATPPLETFQKHVNPGREDECWLWTGPADKHGYGMISAAAIGIRTLRAHRFSYMHYKGPIPAGLSVRHACDVPACVNPNHLSVGTHWENMNDCKLRGRTARPRRPRKLDAKAISEVRDLATTGMFQREIAKKFGVSQRTVAKIVNRLNGYASW